MDGKVRPSLRVSGARQHEKRGASASVAAGVEGADVQGDEKTAERGTEEKKERAETE